MALNVTQDRNSSNQENKAGQLPIGLASFEDLRSINAVYVDKTDKVYELAKEKSFYFMARPRRFGKTLLLNTFASLFQNKLRYFKYLKIEKLWTEDVSYPVIRLNFAQTICQTGSFDDFKLNFEVLLRNSLKEAGFDFPPKEKADTLAARFQNAITSTTNKHIVLLIDEYDAPLNSTLNEPKLFEKIRSELNSFYVVVKELSYYWRFLFITGICKYKNLSIFSATNFITDISLFSKYGDLLGYTEDELKEYFSPFIENATTCLKISFNDCIEQMRINYDGNCFDEDTATHVYTPWSVLSFLKYPERGFKNYWYTSGGNASVLLNYIKDNSLSDPSMYAEDKIISIDDLDSCKDLSNLNELSLLVQTGYLTIKQKLSDTLYILNYPNKEVSNSFARLYGDKFATVKTQQSLLITFLKGTADDIITEFNSLLLSIPYHHFMVKNESILRMVIGCSLKACGLDVEFEHVNAHGRSDIEVKCDDRLFVIELKFTKTQEQATKLLDNAIAQIKKCHYGEQISPSIQHIHMALVYSESDRKITASKIF